MPSLTGGGASNITGAQIVDGTIADADVSASAAIALSKLSGLIGNPGSFISVETGTGTSYALTTLANQRVIVIAKGVLPNVFGGSTATLAYNAVTKDSIVTNSGASSNLYPFTMMYTEIPGAGTHNITLGNTGGNEVIIVIKLMVG